MSLPPGFQVDPAELPPGFQLDSNAAKKAPPAQGVLGRLRQVPRSAIEASAVNPYLDPTQTSLATERLRTRAPVVAGLLTGDPLLGTALAGTTETAATGSLKKGFESAGETAAGNLLLGGASKLLGPPTKKALQYALRPAARSYLSGAEPVEQVTAEQAAGRLPSVASRPTLLQGVAKLRKEAGKDVGSLVGAAKGAVNLRPALQQLDETIMQLDPEFDEPLIRQLQAMRTRVLNDVGGEEGLGSVPAKVAQRMKQSARRGLNYLQGEAGSAFSQARKTLTGGIDQALDEVLGPAYSEANKRFASLKTAQGLLRNSVAAERAGKLEPTLLRKEVKGALRRIWPYALVGSGAGAGYELARRLGE